MLSTREMRNYWSIYLKQEGIQMTQIIMVELHWYKSYTLYFDIIPIIKKIKNSIHNEILNVSDILWTALKMVFLNYYKQHIAAAKGYTRSVEALLEHGASVSIRGNY